MPAQRTEKERDALLATMYRMDPDRLRQLRRIASGVTRCPECDAPNPAGERFCRKCRAKLYPVEEAEEQRLLKKRRGDGGEA